MLSEQPILLVPDVLKRLDGHEGENDFLELHEVDDEADADPEQEEDEDVDAGDDQVEAQEPGPAGSFAKDGHDVSKDDDNYPEAIKVVNEINIFPLKVLLIRHLCLQF